jgi:hypothetical protein
MGRRQAAAGGGRRRAGDGREAEDAARRHGGLLHMQSFTNGNKTETRKDGAVLPLLTAFFLLVGERLFFLQSTDN